MYLKRHVDNLYLHANFDGLDTISAPDESFKKRVGKNNNLKVKVFQ